MAQDRQFIVEVLDAQGNLAASVLVSGPNVVGSRITGTTAGAAASLVTWAGNGQSATVGAAVTPPGVRVLDASGLPVAGSTVTFELGTGQSASASGMTQTTNSNGVATVGAWSVGTTAGQANTLLARSGNLTNSPLGFTITPTAGSASSVSVSAGNSQNTTPVTTLTSRLTALVHDQYGNPVTGATVTWSSSDGDAAFGAATSTTNSSGLAGVVYTTGQSASTVSVYGTIASGASARFGIGTYAAAPTEVTIVSGNNQTALSGATLANPLVVGVSDGYGNPWSSGQTLQFVIVAGSGNVSSATSTPASGVAQVTWQMGATAGINLLEVSLAGISNSTVTFTASGTNPVADTIQVESGNNQSGTVGAALSLPLAVATLGSGSSASGQVVVWSVDSGSLSTTITKSSTSGIARTVWTLPTGAGAYAASASAGTLTGSPVAFAATATAATVAKLVVTTQPSSNPQPGVAWPQQPVVVSADQYGNPVSTNTRVGVVLASGDGTLASAVSLYAVASGATATFSGLSYTYVSDPTFQVEFEARSLSTATATAQVSQPPFASQLAFTSQPQNAAIGQTLGTVTVAVQDSNGGTVTGATNTVTVALTGTGTLSGTLSKSAVAGVATFGDLAIDTAGNGNVLTASATGLTGATSATFNVSATNRPNEPTGMTTKVDTTWATGISSSNPASGGATSGWWRYATGNTGTSATDANAPYHPNNLLKVTKTNGSTQGTGPEHLSPGTANTYIYQGGSYGRIYLHGALFVPAGYRTPAGSGVHKVFHLWGRTDGFTSSTGASLLVPSIVGAVDSTTASIKFQMRLQNVGTLKAGSDRAINLDGNINGGVITMTRGSWLPYQILATMNTAGNQDGRLEVWIYSAGAWTKRMEYTDIDWSSAAVSNKIWTNVQLNPTYGGTGTTNGDQELWYDGPYISAGV